MSQDRKNKISFPDESVENDYINNPGSYNDFSNNLENKDGYLSSEILSLYSTALAKYRESLNLDEKERYSNVA